MAKQLPHRAHAQSSGSVLRTIKRKGKKRDYYKFQRRAEHWRVFVTLDTCGIVLYKLFPKIGIY